MRTELSSRERILAAVAHQEPDHVPLWNLWRNRDVPFTYRDQVERVEAVTALGLDDTLLLEPPLRMAEYYLADLVPGITCSVAKQQRADEPYPLLTKEYRTPAGPLRQVIRQTEDWPFGDDVTLLSDFNIPRGLEFPVKGSEDLPPLGHLLAEPSRTQLESFREHAAGLRHHAKRLGVVLDGGWTALGDTVLWLLGTERLLYAQMDQPDFVEEVLEAVCQWELRRMQLVLDEGAEVIVHSAWYETTDFWTPTNFRRLLKPRLARMVALAHEAGARFSYIMTTSWQALADDLLELGIDSLVGVDPVQGKADLRLAKQQLGARICLWGGVNSAVTLRQGNDEEIREATEGAIRTLAPGGGFVLYPVDQLLDDMPWQRVEVMIERWRQVGSYPI